MRPRQITIAVLVSFGLSSCTKLEMDRLISLDSLRATTDYVAKGVHLDGNSWLSVANLNATNSASFSYSGWFRYDVGSSVAAPYPTLFVSDPAKTYANSLYSITVPGYESTYAYGGDGTNTRNLVAGPASLGSWHHFLYSVKTDYAPATQNYFGSPAMSANSQFIVIPYMNNGVYVSTNGGQSFTLQTGVGAGNLAARPCISDDGQVIAVGIGGNSGGASNGPLYISTNGGSTWSTALRRRPASSGINSAAREAAPRLQPRQAAMIFMSQQILAHLGRSDCRTVRRTPVTTAPAFRLTAFQF